MATMDQQPKAPSRKGLVGVTVLCLLIAAAVVLFVVTQRSQPGPRFRIAAPFLAPCSGGGDNFRCYAIRVDNVGNLPGSVACEVTDTAAGVASFVDGSHTYRSAPIEAGREVFVIVQVDTSAGTDPGTAPAPNATCAGVATG
jgi:hypothetical protein